MLSYVTRYADAKELPLLWENPPGWVCLPKKPKPKKQRERDAEKIRSTYTWQKTRERVKDASYFKAVYREAVELTAYLCRKYALEPLRDGVVLCHAEGYKRGIAPNHGDVLHWFPRFGKSMDDFRADVAKKWRNQS